MASAAIVSFRLGGSDGVSVEAAKWAWALSELGFDVTTVAGSGTADVILPELSIGATEPPSSRCLSSALEGVDLVVVENLCSLPLNPAAARVVAGVLHGRRAVMHHHDLPWQRDRFANFGPPPTDRSWLHVTINELSRAQLCARGMRAVTVYNTFAPDAPVARRSDTREHLGVRPDQTLLLQPTRAIERKNVPAALRLAEKLEAVLWVLGPAEEGYGPTLEQLINQSAATVVHAGRDGAGPVPIGDAYSACDAVVLPSTWEGFGNPSLESVQHRRPLAIGNYPVASELARYGFRWFGCEDPGVLASWLAEPDAALLDHNLDVLRRHFNLYDLPTKLERVMRLNGWLTW